MNAGLTDSHPSIRFYDSDYPGKETTSIPSNFDETTALQGLAHDVKRFKELAAERGGAVLELCCGTGRVVIPLARQGHAVHAVDISEGMLQRLRQRLAQEEPSVRSRVTIERQDITRLELEAQFSLATLAFNSLLCITDFRGQLAALHAAARHLEPDGVIAIDLVNPRILPLGGDPVPKPFFTRRDEHTGAEYTRFAAVGAMEADQRQRLYGWYDEIGTDGLIRRTTYSLFWRPIFRYEAELMVEMAGLEIVSIEGGHQHEPFTASSPKMFIVARRRGGAT
jgi:SAM-dependent methyltransferase